MPSKHRVPWSQNLVFHYQGSEMRVMIEKNIWNDLVGGDKITSCIYSFCPQTDLGKRTESARNLKWFNRIPSVTSNSKQKYTKITWPKKTPTNTTPHQKDTRHFLNPKNSSPVLPYPIPHIPNTTSHKPQPQPIVTQCHTRHHNTKPTQAKVRNTNDNYVSFRL